MNLHFCKDQQSLAARVLHASDDVMIMRTGREIPLAIKALQDGRDVLAIANSTTSTGWRAPEGTIVTLDEGIDAQLAEQARMRVARPAEMFHQPDQIEGRLHRPGSAPVTIIRDYQAEAMASIEGSMKLDGDAFVVRAHAGLGKFAPDPVIEDPFEAVAEPDDKPAGPQF